LVRHDDPDQQALCTNLRLASDCRSSGALFNPGFSARGSPTDTASHDRTGDLDHDRSDDVDGPTGSDARHERECSGQRFIDANDDENDEDR
jgi:hypothetical protein